MHTIRLFAFLVHSLWIDPKNAEPLAESSSVPPLEGNMTILLLTAYAICHCSYLLLLLSFNIVDIDVFAIAIFTIIPVC